jgi:Second Messenger Oligonucleotide or Dinucleotide Synthetase domain
MGTGLPPKGPYPGLGLAGRNALTGAAVSDLFAGYSLPVVPPSGGALAALAGTTYPGLGSPARSALTGAAVSDLFSGYPPPPPPYASALAAFGALSPPSPATSLLFGTPTTPVGPWHYVRWRFNTFLANLTITPLQREDGDTKHAGVRACLNRHYYGTLSETANSLLIGSWGKGTQVRPSRDIDILFLLPASIWQRYQQRDGNKQSQLLQEVKEILAATYSQTTMRGDGQVISIPFNTMPIELSPGFRCQDGTIIICDTNDGGRYKTSTAETEETELSASDLRWNGNTRALARMLKQWQREQNAPLKSFVLERLALHFLAQWSYSHHDVFWYDWMIRDFFAWLLQFANGTLTMPLTNEVIPLGNEWQVRAQRAHANAVSACEREHANSGQLAGEDWQKIFGAEIPVT